MEFKTIKLSVTNCYLLPVQGKYVLIDTGYEEDGDLFRAGLDQAGVAVSDISHLILTHHHDDHCGLLNKLTQENPAIRVVMSDLASDYLLVGHNDRTHGGGLINRNVERVLSLKQLYLSLVLRKKISPERNLVFSRYHKRANDILVHGTTRLKDIGIGLDGDIIETPGHSTDSISVILDDGDAFVGDAAANFLQFTGTKYCVIFVEDLDEYYRSWEKIIAEKVQRIFPAHGKPFSVARLKENIGKNKKENMLMN